MKEKYLNYFKSINLTHILLFVNIIFLFIITIELKNIYYMVYYISQDANYITGNTYTTLLYQADKNQQAWNNERYINADTILKGLRTLQKTR